MGTEETPPQAGDRATGVDEQVAGTDDEGRRAAGVAPDIGDDAVHDQTQTPAAADDVEQPPDEEMNRPDE